VGDCTITVNAAYPFRSDNGPRGELTVTAAAKSNRVKAIFGGYFCRRIEEFVNYVRREPMKRLLLQHLLIIFLVSLAGCSSKSLPGKWRVTKSGPEKRENGLSTIEFTESGRDYGGTRGGFNMVQNNGTSRSGNYITSDREETLRGIILNMGRDSTAATSAGIYKFEGGKLILKIAQNLSESDFERLSTRPPRDFNQQSGFDVLELERQ
jgi:hypothetical protein